MAVQAQYPSNVILTDYRKRARQLPIVNAAIETNQSPGSSMALLGAVEDPQPVAPNLLRFYNYPAVGMNMIPQHAMSLKEADNNEVMAPASRKRAREKEELLLARQQQQQQVAFLPPSYYQQDGGAAPFGISHLPFSTGLRPVVDEARPTPPPTVTSASERGGYCLSSILGDELQAHYITQNEEIDQIIKIQSERMRQLLEEKRQRHTRAMLALMEEGLCRRLKEKEEEAERAKRLSVDLEDRVKQLSIESQLWQNLARKNEAMVSSLRSSLEQVVVQSREQSKTGGCGETCDADDAESCNQVGETGGGSDALNHAHAKSASLMRENNALQHQRACRVCRANSSCILLLPCRHLCLCKECDAGQRAHCPICKAPKNASVLVYMD